MSFEMFGSFLFGLGLLVFYFLIYRIQQYNKKQGYKTTIPFPELFKFLSDCSKIQKESKDKTLWLLLISLNIVFIFCVIVLLAMVFT